MKQQYKRIENIVEYDAIIIGGGHNGLVVAAYLVKEGLKSLVLEKYHKVGGYVITEEVPELPGFKLDRGGIVHIFIQMTPIIKDLELEKYGLKYIWPEVQSFFPFPDGKYWFLYKDLDKTIGEIERVAPEDARVYRDYFDFWSKLDEMTAPIFLSPPISLIDMLAPLPKGPEADEIMRALLAPVDRLLDEWFDTDYVKAPAARLGGEIGFDPRTPAMGMYAGAIASWAKVGMPFPEGGSGKLTEALAKYIEAHGGIIRTNAEVERIIVKDGKAVGVRLTTGEEIMGKVIISQLDAKRVFLRLIEKEYVESKLRRRIEAIRAGYHSTGINIHLELNELPKYTAHPDGAKASLQWISPSMDYIYKGWDDIRAGSPCVDYPILTLFTPTALDPTRTPRGKHYLYIWSFQAGKLANGKKWEDVKEEVADALIDKVTEYAPNVKDAIIGRVIDDPASNEKRTGDIASSFIHVDMTIDQMFNNRPLPELSHNRTPIENLYLTGSGTHLGGGISGIPGYLASKTVLEDWKTGKIK